VSGQRIGRYEVKQEIGRGGMATVYLARDPRFKRDVAIKVLPRQFTNDEMFRIRFEREAQMIAALDHQAIVPVYDYGEQEGQPYLVMRYMMGGSLSERLKQGPIPLAEVTPILERIASALDRAHQMGIIHRDLKPGNILFDQYGDAFLADFGIAKMAEATAALTGSALIGTPAYMSPEQVKGESIDGRSDIYTLGVILFEMLTGQQPFQADTPFGVAMKHINDPPPYLLEKNKELPPQLDETIRQAMSKQAGDRFATASDLATRLKADVQATTRPAMPKTVPDKTTPDRAELPTEAAEAKATSATAEPVTAPAPEAPPSRIKQVPPVPEKTIPRKRPPWFRLAVGVIVVIFIGLLIWGDFLLNRENNTLSEADDGTTGPAASQFIQAQWQEGYRTTGLAFGNRVWAVTMSQDSPYGRQTWQTARQFPSDFIETQWDEGFRVTDLTYGNGVWAVIMSQESGYGRQTWQTARLFPSDFVEAQWDEGFRVTSLTYGNGVWAVIMSQESGYGRQTWQTARLFPSDFIETQWDEGFRVTDLTYGNGVWAVVMSEESPYGRQTWQTARQFPADFIEMQWPNGFRVTNFTYGNGVWAVIMSQNSPYGRQTWQTARQFSQ